MKRILPLLLLFLSFPLFSQQTSLEFYTLEAASKIKKLESGDYELSLTGPLNTNTLSKISRAMAANKKSSFTLDLSGTTALYELDKDVLASCPNLTSLTLSDSIIRISFFAFMGSSGLAEIHAPEGNETFASIDGILYSKDYSRLTLVPPGRRGKVTIAHATSEVDGTAFSLSPFVTAIDVEAEEDAKRRGAARSDGSALPDSRVSPVSGSRAHSNETFEAIDGLLYSLDHTRFVRCPAGRSQAVVLLENVRTLEPHAFENCTLLSDIRINDGLERADYGSFALCTSLSEINFPPSLAHIGKQAFYGCTRLQKFSVPAGVSYVGSRSFFKSDIRNLLFEVQEGWIYGRKATKSLESPASNAQEFTHPGRYWSYDVEKE